MNLAKATQMALVGTVLALIVELVEWGMSTFASKLLYEYGAKWLWETIWLSLILLRTVPLIIFFSVLSKKQKGG